VETRKYGNAISVGSRIGMEENVFSPTTVTSFLVYQGVIAKTYSVKRLKFGDH
jgi:hypothetical protein